MSLFKLERIMPPMLTLFTVDEELDEEALRKEARYMLGVGVHGLTVCGSTREGYSITAEEIGRVTTIVKEEAGSQVPVITGVIADSANIALSHGGPRKRRAPTPLW